MGKSKASIVSSICILIVVMLACRGLALDKLTSFVNDEAGVISDGYEELLTYELETLAANTSVEMAVATVENLGDIPIEEYSLKLAHGVLGEEGKDNGILILLAPNEREYRIEVGYGLEPIISASTAGKIGRAVMEPYFKEGNYEEGLWAGVIALEDVINGDTSWETTASAKEDEDVRVIVIAVIIIAVVFLMIAYASYRQEKGLLKASGKDSDFTAAAIVASMFGRGRGGGGFSGGSSGGFGGFGGGSFGGGGFSGKF